MKDLKSYRINFEIISNYVKLWLDTKTEAALRDSATSEVIQEENSPDLKPRSSKESIIVSNL